MTTTLYTAALVVPVTAPPIVDGAVAVKDGRILHVGDRRWVAATLAERGLDFEERPWHGVLTPGLVNAHTHLQYTRMAAVGQGRYQGFPDWAKAFNPVYEAGSDWAKAATEGARLLLESGTTAAADVVTDAVAAGALHDSGLHGIAYWEVMDWTNDAWTLRGRAEVERALDALPSSPGTGLSPHAPYSLEIVPLLDIPDIVRERGSRLHIHLGEHAIERELEHTHPDPWHGKGVGSLRELRDAGYGTSATEYVDHLGVLGPDCHIAHGVYLSAKDRAILRSRGSAVALCPRSNDAIGLGEPPVAAYLEEGSFIAVGTDSLASAPSLDVLGDVAMLFDIARRQGYHRADLAERLLAAATLGGARAMGLHLGKKRTGYLAVGARADLALFDVPVTTPDAAIDELVRHGEGRAAATIVAGETLFAREDAR
jgi:cytosine/adenosine deaminase-related metal-dependent hydrolase